jgi:hypothetical protein
MFLSDAMAYATFRNLFTEAAQTARSMLKKPLGPYDAVERDASTGFVTNISKTNAIEIQFAIDASARAKYRNIRPMQWAATQSGWKKEGAPLSASWVAIPEFKFTGDQVDNPMTANWRDDGSAVAWWDCPGPSIVRFAGLPVSRLYVVQNFKAYVVGDLLTNGNTEQLCALACWCSVVDMVNANWSDPTQAADWQRWNANDARMGWADTGTPTAP